MINALPTSTTTQMQGRRRAMASLTHLATSSALPLPLLHPESARDANRRNQNEDSHVTRIAMRASSRRAALKRSVAIAGRQRGRPTMHLGSVVQENL